MSKFKILHIDDDLVALEFLKVVLMNLDVEIINSSSSLDGIKLYDKIKPDMLILDINMPIMGGLELAKKIREENQTIKIVILSSSDDTHNLLDAIDLKIDKYFIKPVVRSTFLLYINDIVINYKKEKDLLNHLKLTDGFFWDRLNNRLLKNNKIIKLSKKEMLFFSFLAQNDKIYSTDDILNYLWKDDISDDYNTSRLRGLISRLKKKTEINLFESVYGVGYRLKR